MDRFAFLYERQKRVVLNGVTIVICGKYKNLKKPHKNMIYLPKKNNRLLFLLFSIVYDAK